MSSLYRGLSRAQLSYDYLHTNSTTHEFLFGALAELLDNARDASATKINIYSVADQALRGGYMLCFLDDGQGMSPGEAYDIITFGKSTKKSTDSQLIGMYGNGLKSGSMRIGNDFILFTKKGPTLTCVFLSRTFHEVEQLDEIIVPMPSFDSQTKKPWAKTPKEKEKHQTEMELILKYSPFKTEAQFMKEFDKIESSFGTVVIVYNLKLLDSGLPELDVRTSAHDILLSHPEVGSGDTDDGLMPERKSFRAYASILYVEPRMRVYIQGRKVRTKRLVNTLYKPRLYRYSSARFKARSETEAKRAEEDAKTAENRAKEAESKSKNLELKYANSVDKEHRAELRKAQTVAVELRKETQLKKTIAERKTRSLRDPKQITFVFGINIENRSRDGVFVYNCSRLIKMYQKVGPQADGGVFCSGVVGVVDVPYLVLEPTHNKQDFADAKEYRHLQQAMGEHMLQYWKDLEIAQQGVTKFWENFGYISPNWRDLPSTDPKFIRKRTAVVQATLQCDLCLKWRILPFSANTVGKVFPDDWVCSMNPDPAHNRCSSAEEKLNIPEGVLKRSVKTQQQKEKDLEAEIEKKQSMLQKIQKSKPETSNSRRESDLEDSRSRRQPQPNLSSDSRTRQERREAMRERPARRRGVADSESGSSVSAVSSSDSEPDVEPPAKKKTPAALPKSRESPVRKTRNLHDSSQRNSVQLQQKHKLQQLQKMRAAKMRKPPSVARKEEDESSVESSDSEIDDDDARLIAEIGTKVRVHVAKKWSYGVVVDMNRSKDKWKIVLDKHPNSYQWCDRNSRDVKIIKVMREDATEARSSDVELTTADQQTASVAVSDAGAEAPSSSTVAPPTSVSSDEITNGYRTCLRYFLPPQWIMDKDAVSALSTPELAQFPLDDFFDHYEKGLRKLVSSFQQEASTKQQEADAVWSKLSNVRRMIAKLLKTMNDEFELDPESDTDQVDELLSLCLKQALSQASSSSKDTGTAASSE